MKWLFREKKDLKKKREKHLKNSFQASSSFMQECFRYQDAKEELTRTSLLKLLFLKMLVKLFFTPQYLITSKIFLRSKFCLFFRMRVSNVKVMTTMFFLKKESRRVPMRACLATQFCR